MYTRTSLVRMQFGAGDEDRTRDPLLGEHRNSGCYGSDLIIPDIALSTGIQEDCVSTRLITIEGASLGEVTCSGVRWTQTD